MPTGRHLRSGQGGAEMLQLSAASQSSGCRGGDRHRQRGGGQEAASAARRPHVDMAKGGDVRERSMDGVTRWSRIRPQAPRAAGAASPHQTEPLWRAAPTQSPAPLPSTGPSRAPTPPCGTRDTALALAAMVPSSSPSPLTSPLPVAASGCPQPRISASPPQAPQCHPGWGRSSSRARQGDRAGGDTAGTGEVTLCHSPTTVTQATGTLTSSQ